jgi:CheY-like chemotaxis protein
MDGIVKRIVKETIQLKKNKMKKELYIIDDDLIFRMIVSKTINKMDSLVINQCENGAIGLNMLKEQSDANYKIIVLLDINMPVIDGWSF